MRRFHFLMLALRTRRGATTVEYALILAFVVLAMLAALTHVADGTVSMWSDISNKVTTAR